MSDAEWRTVKLGDVSNIQTGPFGSQLHASDYVDAGIPSIMPTNIGDNRINEAGIACIKQEDALRLSKYLVQEGDIVYSRRGDVEKRAIIRKNEEGWLCGTGCLRIRVDKCKIYPPFASFFLGYPPIRAWIVQHAQGATMPNLNTSILSQVPFSYPEYEEQRAIAATLSPLDDKIELNHRINKTLEEMAQALFKRWFVDFEFPDENGQPYKSSGGEMEESELGPIPKGWRVESLDSIADYLNGLAMQKYRPEGEEFIPVIKIRELNQGKPDVQSDKASPNIDSKYIVNDGDVLFSWSGSLDVKIWCGGKGGLNQHLFKVTSVRYEKWFYYLWTKHHLEKFRGIAQDKATTMGHIQRKHLAESLVIVPAQEALERMNSVMRPIFDIFITREIEAATLVAISDTILPKLISGEIRLNGSFAEDIINGEG